MPPELDSEQQPPTTGTPPAATPPESPEGGLSNVAKALEAERTARKNLEKQLGEHTKTEQELQAKLDQYKEIDPELYSKLLREEREREERDLLKRKEFDKVQQIHQAEKEAALKAAKNSEERYTQLAIETAVKNAFYETGGRRNSFDLSSQGGEDVAPVDAILAWIRPRLKLEGEKVVVLNAVGGVELNSEGKPKTVSEKMAELRKGSMGSLFLPENNSSGGGMTPTITTQNGQQVKVYSREQARLGKASIDDIASGKGAIV